jgi:aminoglycoside phosphotransferase (APT) family kinase protein
MERIRAALKDAFGTAPVGAIAAVGGGATSASLFRAEVDGRTRLVRFEGEPSPLRNPHQYESLRIAAEAGIAPKLYYVDETRGIAVMDFIEAQPLRDYPGGSKALAAAVGALLWRLQDAPLFPYFVDFPDIVARLFEHVRSTGLFADGLLDPYTERLERIRESWPRVTPVSSHNDPNPRNILYDGERLWLVDWESAYRNDPLVDVAIVLDNLAPSPELEEILLRSWLGRAPDETVRAHLAPARALSRLWYAGVLLSASATTPRTAPDTDLSVPSVPKFLEDVRSGSLKPRTYETVHTMGKMYLAGFLTGCAVPALDAL